MPNNLPPVKPGLDTLLARLGSAFPALRFDESGDFYWSSDKQTIFYAPIRTCEDAATLLHEVAHALLGHHSFSDDVALLKRENDAWSHARLVLSPRFAVAIEEEAIQGHLDTYREWLYARSLCPACNQTGLQTGSLLYNCVNCLSSWRVNDARTCRLRRDRVT